MKNVSVIIPTYKRSDRLIESVESVRNQSYKFNIEIIVVDDNGENEFRIETEKNLKNLIDNNLIKYIKHKENQGACKARNTGANIAKGDYLFFLDDDDVFLVNKIETQVNFLEKNDFYDGCLSAFTRLDNDLNRIISDSNYPVVGNFKNFVINGNFFTPMLCIKKQSFDKIGGFKDINRFQDRFFMLHCLKNEMNFGVINDELYIMHEHMDNRITKNSVLKSIESLNTIKDYIMNYQKEFTKNEWTDYLVKDDNMRATIYYVSSNYITRLKSFSLWFNCFKNTYKINYLVKCMKSLFPNVNKKY